MIHEKCHDNFLESLHGDLFKVIVLKPLTLLGLCDDMFSPSKKFVAFAYALLRASCSKVWGDKYQMMCGITCFKSFG